MIQYSNRPNEDLSAEARRLLELIKTRPISEEDRERIVQELTHMNQTTAGKYIMCVLFPELSDPCRFPMAFPNPTAVFRITETYEFYPGPDASFFIEYFPQNVSFKEDDDTINNSYLVIYTAYDDKKNGGKGGFVRAGLSTIEAGTGLEGKKNPALEYTDEIGDHFEQVALRGASIRVFYVGEYDKMSGYLESCIDYHYDGVAEKYPQKKDITKGFYRQYAKPSEGLRAIWFPKDYNDYNFRRIRSKGDDIYDNSRVCIIGAGLEHEPIRVEVVRHFEGFPRIDIKDYVDTRRPKAVGAGKTMEALGEVHNVAPGLLTLKPADVNTVASKLKKKSWNFDSFLKGISNYADRAMELIAKGSAVVNFASAIM